MLESSNIRHLTPEEQLNAYLENLIRYQEEMLKFTNKEIEETKEKIKVLKMGGENGCRN